MNDRIGKVHFSRTLFTGVVVSALLWACADSSEVVTNGTSETTVTANKKIRLTVRGPMTFPDAFPAVGGMHVAEGVDETIELEPGESIVLDDTVGADGVTITGAAERARQAKSNARRSTVAMESVSALRDQPYPKGRITFNGTIRPDSTYTWAIPYFFGTTQAEPTYVTGTVSATLKQNALIDDGSGNYTIAPMGILAASYTVNGPPAHWPGPIETPYGTITGTGYIETETGMTLEFIGGVNSISASGWTGYTDPDGIYWEFGYSGAYPVKLSAGGGEATGATTVIGGFDVY